MRCDNLKIQNIRKSNIIGCSWSYKYSLNRWGNYPSVQEIFAGDYQNNILKPNSEEKFFVNFGPLK